VTGLSSHNLRHGNPHFSSATTKLALRFGTTVQVPQSLSEDGKSRSAIAIVSPRATGDRVTYTKSPRHKSKESSSPAGHDTPTRPRRPIPMTNTPPPLPPSWLRHIAVAVKRAAQMGVYVVGGAAVRGVRVFGVAVAIGSDANRETLDWSFEGGVMGCVRRR